MSDNNDYNNQNFISSSSETTEAPVPSAPTSDENGYIVVNENTQNSDTADLTEAKNNQAEISNLLADINSSTEAQLKESGNTVLAEADSSVAKEEKKPERKSEDKKECSMCPYYLLACDYITKIQVPPKVQDLLLWKCPKLTGAVFGSMFVLLLSFSLFSFLTVISALMLTAMAIVGAYRFYAAVVFRIKGVYDDSLDKLAKQDLPLPKDKIQNLARLIEDDLYLALNRLKSVVLWESVSQSVKALLVFYAINWVGSCFNFLTLLLIGLVTVFTMPKVYQVYKKQIDQGVEKMTTMAHQIVKQVMVKIPILNKKKTQ